MSSEQIGTGNTPCVKVLLKPRCDTFHNIDINVKREVMSLEQDKKEKIRQLLSGYYGKGQEVESDRASQNAPGFSQSSNALSLEYACHEARRYVLHS